MKKIHHPLGIFIASLLIICSAIYPAMAVGVEALQVAYINNFIRKSTVFWPSPHDIASQSSINVCLIGKSSVSKTIAALEQSSDTVKVKVKNVSSAPTKAGDCHVLFIGSSAPGGVEGVTQKMSNTPTLTVSDTEGFIDKGGMIGFVVENKKIRMHINKGAANAAGLKLNTELLDLAKRVKR